MQTTQIPSKLDFFLKQKARYKVAYGGRGSGKSHSIATSLIIESLKSKKRILCTRELQTSIADSVHKLLSDKIDALGYRPYFKITEHSIKNYVGSEFIFKGLRRNVAEIKSLEGIDICWVEEAEKVSHDSWNILIPTIRKEGSEIWVSFNPNEPDDETYKRFALNPPPDCISVKINYDDNPFFPDTLLKEMNWDKYNNPDKYYNVWCGEPKTRSEAQIFRNRWAVKPFETPALTQIYQNRFFYGVDWGFANDPTAIIRCFIMDYCLYIDYEAYGVGVELDELPQLFNSIPEINRWKLYADAARPETVSHMARRGYNIFSAPKWQGSVEDGIAYLKSFKQIIIHERCKNTAYEFKNYKYKIDRNTSDILPVVDDKDNHTIDAIRYALADYIRKDVSILEVI